MLSHPVVHLHLMIRRFLLFLLARLLVFAVEGSTKLTCPMKAPNFTI
jgi:hypothetical protein